MRNLILVLGDQLDSDSAAFRGFDRSVDAVWMAEVEEEATHVWCHKQRLVFFFSAMRHFRDMLRKKGIEVRYHELSADRRGDRGHGLAEVLEKDVPKLDPRRLIVVLPGDYRVKQTLSAAAKRLGAELEIRPDEHFYCHPEEFAGYAQARKSLLLEHFYRHMRRRHRVLMENGNPVGGEWNFDQENRGTFDRKGPERIVRPRAFPADATTKGVLAMVAKRYADHPGSLADFSLPVDRKQARGMLRDFVKRSLPLFGKYEDAMWTGEPFLYHSRLSAVLNVKLLDPRTCVDAAVEAFESEAVPINSAEGFVRQLLGWREFTRGVYWLWMPRYAEMNHFGNREPLPEFYWTGRTEMACFADGMRAVLCHGYAHHIVRLMVFGNLALLLGVDPIRFHEWHMAMYIDAVDWVSLPNTLGMSQHADGGLVGTKPYISTGQYIRRMSNYCNNCPFDPNSAAAERACPFTTLYWDFLSRHEQMLRKNNRMRLQLKNLEAKRQSGEIVAIHARAKRLRDEWVR